MSPSLTLPANLTVRAPTRDELEAIHELMHVSDLDIFGRPDYTMQELQHDWSRQDFDPANDAWVVATPDGQLVGYAHTFGASGNHFRLFGMGVVHPDYYNQGIGSTLVSLTEERARQHVPLAPPEARVALFIGIAGDHEPSERLLTDHGYTKARRFSRMQIVMDAPPPEPVWPEGVTLRTLVPGQDERALWEAMEESFADHWGHAPETFDHWMARHTEPGSLPPDLTLLAMAGDTIAGAAICIYLEDFGWVDTLGVRRPWRKHGLGLALLHQAFGEFYRRGTREVGLGVDAQSLTGATRLYERAGMRPLVHYDSYEKELRPGVELATQTLENA
ncbi:MAG TPA: GNAT family N-acetyltransferase [Ktedonobacterales bacterium]|nr:GNAT family N-acetyltransferase [Ktedonobacterales bacterium]